MSSENEVRSFIESTGGVVREVSGPLPDGSGVAVSSYPLPGDHWSRVDGTNVPPMPLRCGVSRGDLRAFLEEGVRAAARYAVRSSTSNGQRDDFDPDAMVQNFVVGMIGYHTDDGLSSDAGCNPDPVPDEYGRVRERMDVAELRAVSGPDEYGEMLRLATTWELLDDVNRPLGFMTIWDYFLSIGFSGDFIDRVAKVCWRRACDVVSGLPYTFVVRGPFCFSERRLAAHLLREVCRSIARGD